MRFKDGDWELVTHDFPTGRTVWKMYDGSLVHYRTDYPVDNIIKANDEEFRANEGSRFGDGKKVASIPLNVFYDKLHEAQSQGDSRYLRRWLNDGDNAAFRTFKGHL